MKHLVNNDKIINERMEQIEEYIQNNFMLSVKSFTESFDGKFYIEVIECSPDVDYSTQPQQIEFTSLDYIIPYFNREMKYYKSINWNV